MPPRLSAPPSPSRKPVNPLTPRWRSVSRSNATHASTAPDIISGSYSPNPTGFPPPSKRCAEPNPFGAPSPTIPTRSPPFCSAAAIAMAPKPKRRPSGPILCADATSWRETLSATQAPRFEASLASCGATDCGAARSRRPRAARIGRRNWIRAGGQTHPCSLRRKFR